LFVIDNKAVTQKRNFHTYFRTKICFAEKNRENGRVKYDEKITTINFTVMEITQFFGKFRKKM